MILGLKKKDFLLIIIVLVVALGFYLFQEWGRKSSDNQVVVMVNGEIFGTYDLDDDQTVSINNGSNILKIEDHKAKMSRADCPDKLCVHQRAISKANESIICLPNKVVVKITARDQTKDSKDKDSEDIDTVAR